MPIPLENPFYKHVKWKSFSHVQLFATPWTMQSMEFSRPEYWSGSDQISRSVVSDSLWPHESQHSLSSTNSRSSLRLISIESVMPSSHLILCRPLLLLPPIPPSIRVSSMSQLFTWGGQSMGVSALASFLPKKSQGWSPSEWTGWISLQPKGLSEVFSNTTLQKHQFFRTQPSSQSNSQGKMIGYWKRNSPGQ